MVRNALYIGPPVRQEWFKSQNFWIFMEPRNWFQVIDSASQCSPAGRLRHPYSYSVPIASIDCSKIPAQESVFGRTFCCWFGGLWGRGGGRVRHWGNLGILLWKGFMGPFRSRMERQLPSWPLIRIKEVNKEQPSYLNLSATATRVLQCTCPVAASWKYFSAIHTSTSPHLNSLTLTFVKNIILHLLLVLCTAVNVRNKKLLCLMSYEMFSLFGISLDH